MMEDTIERDEQEIQRYTIRPDLQHDPKMPVEPADSETESETGYVSIISALTSS